MKYAFHPEAEAEFLAAIDYYEAREAGFGYDFAIEVHSTIGSVLSFPMAWPILDDEMRRCQLRRFPYGVIYSQHEDVIFILAVMHLRRVTRTRENKGEIYLYYLDHTGASLTLLICTARLSRTQSPGDP